MPRTLPAAALAGMACWLALAGPLAGAEKKKTLDLAWPELAPAVTGRKVEMVLPKRTWIQGEVLAVEPEALRIRVTRTDDSQVCPRGTTSIPRASVSVIRIVRRSRTWRAVLTPAVPAVMLLALAGTINGQHPTVDPRTAVGIGMATTAGAALGGYWFGSALDLKELTVIRISPGGRPAEGEQQ